MMKLFSFMRPTLLGGLLVCGSVVGVGAVDLPVNDYPTATRADYVFGCMESNGRNRDVLMKCSCSIDEIAKLLSFDDYETAETLMSVGLKGGENADWLLHSPQNKKQIDLLKMAQVEAEIICFR